MNVKRTGAKCRFCGGVIDDTGLGFPNAAYMHTLTVRHRDVMAHAGEPKRSPDPYATPDPYVEPQRVTEFVGPMHTILAGVTCQGCRQTVDVVRYTGLIAVVHPNGSLVCQGQAVAT